MVGPACADRLDPALTLLGAEQEAWLSAGFAASPARWNILVQQTLFAPLVRGGARVWTDGWDGYPAARQRLVDAMVATRLSNPLIVGGDVHACYAADIRADPAGSRGPVVASELCGTSITSRGAATARLATLAPANPHLRFVDSASRGYLATTLTAGAARAELRAVSTVKRADAAIASVARFEIEAGRPGVHVVDDVAGA
jgi:alkaline phosphatase D